MIPTFGEARDGVSDLLRVAKVDFVDDENRRQLCPLEPAEKLRFDRSYPVARFYKQEHDVYV